MAIHSSILENPMDRGTWQAIVHRVAKSWTWLKWHKVKVKVKLLSRVRLFATPWAVACTRLLRPWDFLGKSTGVGCHFLLRESSRPRDRTQVSHIVDRRFTIWATRKVLKWHSTYLKISWNKRFYLEVMENRQTIILFICLFSNISITIS